MRASPSDSQCCRVVPSVVTAVFHVEHRAVGHRNWAGCGSAGRAVPPPGGRRPGGGTVRHPGGRARRPNSPRTDIGHHVRCPSRTGSSVSAQGHSPSTHSVVPRGTSMCPSLLVPDSRRPTTIPAEVVRPSSTVTVPPCETRPGRRGPYERWGSAPTVRLHVKPGGGHTAAVGGSGEVPRGTTWFARRPTTDRGGST